MSGRSTFRVLCCSLAGLWAAVLCAGAGGATSAGASVYLIQGESLKAIPRSVPAQSVSAAVEALLRGPTAAESKNDVRTQIPAGTELHKVSISNGIATIDVTRPFVEGTDRSSLVARLNQLVWTATAVPKVTGVRLSIDGAPARSMGQGLSVDRTMTRQNIDPPIEAKLPTGAPDSTGPTSVNGVSTKWIQQRLAALGYLPASAVSGRFGSWSRSAVLAFQGWDKLGRDGDPGPLTIARLKTATRPTPAPGTGKRLDVYLGAQVTLLVDGSRVIRVIKVSSGKPGYATPTGNYTVYRKSIRDWSYPYAVWLPYASYFNGGIAFHEYSDVPAYAASHGCVRVPAQDAPLVYAFAAQSTPVSVLP